MKDIVPEVIRLLQQGQSFALATMIERAGSVPRGVGARMIIRGDKTTAGTVGGGALEGKVQKVAALVLENRKSVLMDFKLTPGDAAGMGMICGGAGRVLIDYVDARNPDWLKTYQELAGVFQQRARAWLVTFLPRQAGEPPAGICVVRDDGTVVGLSGSAAADLQEAIGKASRHQALTFLERAQAVIEPLGNSGTALIFGAGHCAQSLVPVLSSVGFRTVVYDDREEFANREKFGTADEIVLRDSFQDVFQGMQSDENSYIVILTRGHLLDRTVLKQALGTKAAYIGMIGSLQKRDLTFQSLLDEGFTRADLDRVHAPIGLEIKAETPAEIAISIAAELISVRAELCGVR